MSLLKQLRSMTTVVADTGDIEAIRKHKPQDATTNPSLIYKAAQDTRFADLIDETVKARGPHALADETAIAETVDALSVRFGIEILQTIPGRVSTEVDARLSFNTAATLDRARHIIALYEQAGIDRKRILIKIASTWEGIRAAETLEQEGICCNLTLLFSFAQAMACADAKVTLISPFVGRILDWHKADRGVDHIDAKEDPGVASVTAIYNHYKGAGINTEVMGASFRNAGEIIELAGCDLLTISPHLLQQLDEMDGTLARKLDPERAPAVKHQTLTEEAFRWQMNADAMATEKLAQGIRSFDADLRKLVELLRSR